VALGFSVNILEYEIPSKIINHQIRYVDFIQHFGAHLDKALSFNNHITYTCNNISRKIGILYRLSMCSPQFVLKCLYISLVLPYLMYCNLIWGDAASTHLNKFLLLQKRAVRILTSSDYLAHTDGLLQELPIMKIRDLYEFSCCMYVFTPENQYEINHSIDRTRNCELLKV